MKSIVAQEIGKMGAAVPYAFEVTFADGTTYHNRDEPSCFSIRFRNRAVEWGIAAFGHVGMLEGYIDGAIDVEGDLHAAFQAGLNGHFNSSSAIVTHRNRWHEFRRSNASRAQAKANARAHYGLGTDFYRLWLDDPYMMYTCGYWPEGTTSLEEAQVRKMEHVCRKIGLTRGESVADIGFGFGGFMFYAAEQHGVSVTGINTTTEQVEYVNREIRRRAMGDKLRVVEADFRDASGPYDKVVSIGVLEHAGRDQLQDVVRAHAEFLKPGGLGLLHFIGHVGRRDTEFFIREHVFPGGWIPSLADVIVAMEDNGLEIVDIENLRRHYALTLDQWAERFDRNWDRIHALDPGKFNERFRRTWRTYLVSCAEMFRAPKERTHLFQIVFSKGNVSNRNYPMGRGFLYQGCPGSGDAAP
ncbi:MAG: class I SAM-dependent methyltransferase [Betaproteobacteria bacterium]|nr:class I SAM-dependent methyltransferase [Betaproteobacteria bacterium]